MPAAAINPDRILKELRELWISVGKSQEGNGGVLRACSMTLLVAADSHAADIAPADGINDDAAQVHQIIGALMHQHPSRAVVLAPLAEADLSARVFSECWMPYHSRQQICAEGIEITYDPEQSDEVARLLVPLLAPDLPVVLWCRGPRAFLDRSLDPLFPLARKIIFNTSPVRHAPSAIEFLRRLRSDNRRVADLAWTQLTGWRRAIASAFDAAPLASGFSLVRIQHGGDRAPTGAYYMARWMERSLPGLSVIIESVAGEPGLRNILFSGTQPALSLQPALSFQEVAPRMLEVNTGSRVYQTSLPATTEEDLMYEELSILDRDPVFERVLE